MLYRDNFTKELSQRNFTTTWGKSTHKTDIKKLYLNVLDYLLELIYLYLISAFEVLHLQILYPIFKSVMIK